MDKDYWFNNRKKERKTGPYDKGGGGRETLSMQHKLGRKTLVNSHVYVKIRWGG